MTTTQTEDPFAGSSSTPSLSFKDMPVGTSYTGQVLEVPKLTQARDYETGNPAFWDDGNPKMTVVTKLSVGGEERSLWAPKPSAMFAAIQAAQNAAGVQISVGGTLSVTYTGDKPNEKNPRLSAAKQYAVTYTPPNAFAQTEQGQVNTQTGEVQPGQVVQHVAQITPQGGQASNAATAPIAPAGPTPEQVAAVRAAGLDPAAVFPGYVSG